MKIEFVEFYPAQPKKGSNLIGTCHLYLIDYKIDFRGIKVYRSRGKRKFIYKFPFLKSVDIEGNPVKYPIISFMEESDRKAIYNVLCKNADNLVKNWLHSPEYKKALESNPEK